MDGFQNDDVWCDACQAYIGMGEFDQAIKQFNQVKRALFILLSAFVSPPIILCCIKVLEFESGHPHAKRQLQIVQRKIKATHNSQRNHGHEHASISSLSARK